MIIPSIDLQEGRAVQLRRGREKILDGGNPLDRLDDFAVAGEVAVVDLDGALGRGSHEELMTEMTRRAPCRIGGGIRDLDSALGWLDRGAARIVIGTAASVELCSQLPQDRVVAAVDGSAGKLVVEGWRKATGVSVLDRIDELAPHVGGFLLTQVEHEGCLGGFDFELVAEAVRRAGSARVTAAGGITTVDEIARLDALGADAQVGMALYGGHLSLGEAVAAPLAKPIDGEVWPTVVCDTAGRALGLVWSSRESLAMAVEKRRGIYWSRSRGELWIKGETSGSRQKLLRVDLDCDRDALRFIVEQEGSGFCHEGRRSCWPDRFDLGVLERCLRRRIHTAPEASGTAKLVANPALLAAKLREEADELAEGLGTEHVVHEAADLLYFTLVALTAEDYGLRDVQSELGRRSLRVSRRPMEAKS